MEAGDAYPRRTTSGECSSWWTVFRAARHYAVPLLLSYLSAGFAKLISSDWRGGSAIAGVLNTRQYGTWPLAAWLSRYSWSAIFVCWSVILFECLGPLVAFTGQASLVAFLSAGLFSHLVTALSRWG